MIIKHRLPLPLLVVSLFAVALIAGCAAEKSLWGDPDSGLILTYRLPSEGSLEYSVGSTSTESMEMMGQSIKVSTDSKIDFSVASKGMAGKAQHAAVTINASSLKIASPRGELSPDMKNVVGKTFTMNISDVGKESNLEGTESIEYQLGPAGKRNAAQMFTSIFPDMAGKPVKIGDSWTTTDTISQSGGGMNVEIIINGVSTLSGIETKDGHECALITSDFTGTVKGSGQQGPMELVAEGTMEGKDTTYFAYKAGYLVLNVTHALVDATTEGTGPQNITIPSKRTMVNEIRLVNAPMK